ncbi:hypothetical protein FY528_11285 [Hymenobacter lutimineralis]|uniref:Uncharacterized protein n=1 Tax=Hymenobacter lutimineralis TaxID=2606448 RepID=A0A5D6V1F8_9BACT|nr:hypothetical protein [Hymenobacter lutimineralis]TYZ09320.1 hypothetical protein FY528_11285 [Hymenobacter lutimineralis]
MGKHKHKHSKKETVSDDILDAAAISIKKYRKVTNELAKLSSGQKLVGGLMLLAAGYFYLDKVKNDANDSLFAGLDAHLPWLNNAKKTAAPAQEKAADEQPASVPPRKERKHAKPAKAAGSFGKRPAASPDDE